MTNGVKIMLPIGDKREIGNPQLIKIGSDISVIKIWSCKKLTIHRKNLIIMEFNIKLSIKAYFIL